MFSVAVRMSPNWSTPGSASRSITWSTSSSGALAPALRPTVCAPANQLSSSSVTSGTRWAGVPVRAATSTIRTELLELREQDRQQRLQVLRWMVSREGGERGTGAVGEHP